MTREKFIEQFQMTPEMAKHVLTKFRTMVNYEVRQVIAHAEYYIDPEPYGYEGELIKEDDDDDGYTQLYEYGEQNSEVSTFMKLISGFTRYGGHTSAIEACRFMGINWEEENESKINDID